MFGCFTERGVVVRGRGTPDVGDHTSFGLVNIAPTLLTRKGLVESGVRRISRDDERHLLVNGFDEFEGEVSDTFATGSRADDKELDVRVVLFASDAVLEIEVREHAGARGKRCHE